MDRIAVLYGRVQLPVLDHVPVQGDQQVPLQTARGGEEVFRDFRILPREAPDALADRPPLDLYLAILFRSVFRCTPSRVAARVRLPLADSRARST